MLSKKKWKAVLFFLEHPVSDLSSLVSGAAEPEPGLDEEPERVDGQPGGAPAERGGGSLPVRHGEAPAGHPRGAGDPDPDTGHGRGQQEEGRAHRPSGDGG